MSRLLCAALGILIGTAGDSSGQGRAVRNDSLPDVASLRAPATPAFVVLGVSPSDIARPQTPSDLALSLVNSASSATRLPEDLALEVSPYWLRPRPALTWQQDTARSLASSLARTFALSVATTKTGDADAPSTGLGVGVRALLLSGRLSDSTKRQLRAIESAAASMGSIFNRYRLVETRRLDSLQAAGLRVCQQGNPAELVPCAQDVVNRLRPFRDSLTQRIREDPEYQQEIARAEAALDDFMLVREGWFWEVAAGGAWDFADGAWENRDRRQIGIWTTFSHEGPRLADGTWWTPILVARYLERDTTTASGLYDIGGRIVMSAPQYALSFEMVRRFWTGDDAPDTQERMSGMIEYKLREDMWLFGAIGKDYDEATRDSFITRFGLSFSMKKERYQGAP